MILCSTTLVEWQIEFQAFLPNHIGSTQFLSVHVITISKQHNYVPIFFRVLPRRKSQSGAQNTTSKEFGSNSPVKAIVLLELIQKRYLEDHIRDPRKYFPLLKRKKILSQAECSSIKKHEYQVQKFVELISLKEGGYDVFVEALKSLRVNAHVAAHLKRRVSEVDKLYSQGESRDRASLDPFQLVSMGD